MPGRRMWLQDFEVGQTFETPSLTVTEEMIFEFAGRYDPQPFHLDPEAAKDSVFGQLVASGWHTAALTMSLLVAHGPQIEGGQVGLGGEIRWGPVYPGDQLRLRIEVIEVRPSRSNPERGLVRLEIRTLKQGEEEAQRFVVTCLVPARS